MSGLRVVAGAAFPRVGPSAEHDLARAARAMDPVALAALEALVVTGLERDAPDVAAAASAVVVPMAGHRAGTASGPSPRLAGALAGRAPGWTVSGALTRIADAPPAAHAGPRSAAVEAATLRWGTVPGAGPVIVVDDVIHTGASLEAAWLAAPPEVRPRLIAVVALRAVD